MARTFPSFTLAELETRAQLEINPETKARMLAEIKARKAGKSIHKSTPQVKW